MDIPSLFMIPSAVSSGKVHSVFPNSTDADFDFNRDSDATRVNSEGLIERVGYYGSELVVNGNFATNSNWNLGSGDWTISNNFAIANNSNNNLHTSNAVATSTGLKYKVTFELVGVSQGYVRVGLSGLDARQFNSDGTHTLDIVSDGNRYLYFRPFGFTGKLTNVSVVEITGDRARLNYEIEGGLVNTKPSLLLEPQSTNLFTKSNDVDATAATKLDNQITSPEGLQNAALYVENTATASHGAIKSAILPTAGATTYTLSVFAKAKERHLLRLNIYANGASNLTDNFDLINGTVSDANSTIEDFGNGWFRCSTTKTVTNSGGYNFAAVYIGKATNNYYYAGDGQSGLYLFGFQLEQQSYATSYIPTNGSTQTRAAETCLGAGTSSILPSEEGIFFAEIARISDDSYGNYELISLKAGSSGNTDNAMGIGFNQSSDRFWIRFKAGGSTKIEDFTTVATRNVFFKIAIKFKSGNNKIYVNGIEKVANTNTFSALNLHVLNFRWSTLYDFRGKLRDIRVYNTKEMTDSEVDILLTKITS